MTTLFSKPKPVPTAAKIAHALADAVIGQDPTLAALATAVHDQLTRDQPGRPGIFLLAGPDAARAKDAIAHALADVLGYDWGLYNLADPDLTAAQLFRSGPSGPRSGSLSYQLMSAPHSVIVLDAIERADPPALERLIAGWRSGVILDNAGEGIPTDAAVFLLTSAVAPARLGQIGRDDLSADQRHLACLKILSEEGVPAGLLRCVDAAFCLQGLTMRDLAQICRRRLEQQVAAHGLSLTEDGLSAEVLTCAMTSALGVSALAFQHRCVALDRRLAQCRSDGARADPDGDGRRRDRRRAGRAGGCRRERTIGIEPLANVPPTSTVLATARDHCPFHRSLARLKVRTMMDEDHPARGRHRVSRRRRPYGELRLSAAPRPRGRDEGCRVTQSGK